MDTGRDVSSRNMDFKLLEEAFEAVVNSHYRGAVGRIALRLVECPAICSKALSLLSQLCPYLENDSGNWQSHIQVCVVTDLSSFIVDECCSLHALLKLEFSEVVFFFRWHCCSGTHLDVVWS